ncbi:unnamed protein product [Peronospora belbahrii]|nr:unnamed protein product [Peronospora belbahrii]
MSAANLSKERRLFNLEPAHSVVVVSRRTVTADGRPVAQLENLLDAVDLAIDADDILDDLLLQSLARRTEKPDPSQWAKAFACWSETAAAWTQRENNK